MENALVASVSFTLSPRVSLPTIFAPFESYSAHRDHLHQAVHRHSRSDYWLLRSSGNSGGLWRVDLHNQQFVFHMGGADHDGCAEL